jgi:hypothetical protein
MKLNHDQQWSLNLFNRIAEGGTWAVPRSGLVFRKEKGSLVLVARMPYTDEIRAAAADGRDVPQDAETLRQYQDSDYAKIVEVFGGAVVRHSRLMHGKTSAVRHDGRGVYTGLSNPFQAGRYHSLIALEDRLPAELVVTSRTEEGEIMGVRHVREWIEGVQFHPESVLTPEGQRLLANFLAAGAATA